MELNKKVKMVVFDWAGTTVDYGSSAPMVVFELVFKEAGINLTRNEINGPMGMEKKAHIRTLLNLETATKQWKEKYNRNWTEDDVNDFYIKFEDKLRNVVSEYSKPIKGVCETVNTLKNRNIIIASTTGYTSEMMTHVTPSAAKLGYEPDCVVTPDVTGIGRPTPFMLYECMKRFNVYPSETVVKVGDTVTDIYEGKNAGAWSVGILTGSNILGYTEDEYNTADKTEIENRKEKAKEKYIAAGADFVIDNITELPTVIDKINKTLSGEEM